MKTTSEVLEETLDYYLIQNNRRGSYGFRTGNCVYKTVEGFMCAVGRCLTPVSLNMAPVGSVVSCPEVLGGLRPAYMHLKNEVEFWAALQDFHDTYINGCCDSNAKFTHNELRPEPCKRTGLTGAQFLEQLRKKCHDFDASKRKRLQNEVGVTDGIS